jgi:polysaccharide biosynthesis/export protein
MKNTFLNTILSKLTAILFFVLVLFPNLAIAQADAKLDLLIEKLDKENDDAGLIGDGGLGRQGGEQEGYKSFVQNELQNIYAQFDKISEQDNADLTFNEINKKRIELASELCQRDQRACFLIDEYRSYKSREDLPQDFEELKLYGYEIFSGYSNDFNFYDSLPLSDSYKIKIGDRLKISLFGGFNFDQVLAVNMTGSIIITDIGEFQVAGLTYKEASLKIKDEIGKKYVGTEAYISLEQIRSKQIFALGNVKSPGTYALNAFGSPLNALISAGGIKENSSLRSIQVLRDSKAVKTIDLYDLLINGDVTSSDFLLNDGDSILVGGLKSRVSIIGEVVRPAIYEIVENESLEQLLKFALGTTPFADLSNISIERLLPSGQSTIIKPKNTSSFLMKNGDKVVVNSSKGQKINSILVSGAIRNAGEYSLQDASTLGSIIKVQTDLLDNTYIGFGVIKRLNYFSKSYRMINFSLSSQEELDRINLYSGDKVFVFSHDDIAFTQSKEVASYLYNKTNQTSNSTSRSTDLKSNPLLAAKALANTDLKKLDIGESGLAANLLSGGGKCLLALDVLTKKPISNLMEAKLKIFPANKSMKCTSIFQENDDLLPILLINSIPVVGNIRFPGLYPSSSTLNAEALFNIAGGFLLSKLNKLPVFDIGIRSRGFGSYEYDDLKNLTNITMLNLQLDQASMQDRYVRLTGEFENPGIFSITKDTKLSDIYARAGGITSQAYPLGGIFTRESVKDSELDALQRSKAELTEILASAVASGYLKQNSTDLVGLISMMSSIDNAQPVGRLVTELNPTQFRTNPSLDIPLEDGDVIYMPKMNNTVTIVGQVLNPVTVPHKVGTSFNEYLKMAGGLKKEADKRKIYAVLPNGISSRKKSGIALPLLPNMPFQRSDILPGTTIIVPRQARPLDSLALIQTVTPVLANLSVTAASIAAISDN